MSRLIFWFSITFTMLFLAVPMLLVLPLAFNDSSFLSYPMEGFSLRWFEEALINRNWPEYFLNSLKVAFGAMIVGLLVGGLAATGVMLTGRFMQVLLSALFVSPLVIPSIVLGVAFTYSYSRIGLAGSYFSLVIAHAVLGAPLVFLSIMTSLRGLDTDLDLAAASLGASRLHRFFHVTLPLAMPGFLAGGLLAFITSFDEVVVALFLASPESTTLPVALFSGLRDRLDPTIVVVALLLTVLSLALLWLLSRLQHLGGRAS